MIHDDDEDDAKLRGQWRTLVDDRLPKAARRYRDWPVYRNHCFARILLDNACGIPWREAVKPPAWRNMPPPALQMAIDLGNSILDGSADIWALNDASLIMRGKPAHGKKPASPQSRRRFKTTGQTKDLQGRAVQARRFDGV